MPYENYDPYMGGRRSSRNDGQSLINFSQFQPTFVGRPVNEIGGAYKAYREQADFINNTEDVLAQTLSQANVDPKDRAGIAERINMLNAGVKDISEAGDFGPARIKLRNLYNKITNDQFIPAATNRYQGKLNSIAEAHKLAVDNKMSPQRLEMYVNEVENAFSPTTADPSTGLYTKEFIPPQLSEDYDYDKAIRDFMAVKEPQLRSLGYTPEYDPNTGNVAWINANTPVYDYNNPNKVLYWQTGITHKINASDIIKEGVKILKNDSQATKTTQDLSTYYGEDETQFLTDIVTPYANLKAVNNLIMNYDRVREDSGNNQNQNIGDGLGFGLVGGLQFTNKEGLSKSKTPNIVRMSTDPNAGPDEYDLVEDQSNFLYNVNVIKQDRVLSKVANAILKKHFGVDLDRLMLRQDGTFRDPKDLGDKGYVDTALSFVDAKMRSMDPNLIINDSYKKIEPAYQEYKNQQMFGVTKPSLKKSKNGELESSLDLNNTTFVNTDTQEKLTYEQFIDEINLGNGEEIPLVPLGELGADNLLAYKHQDASLYNGIVYNIKGTNYVLGNRSLPVYGDAIITNELGAQRLLPEYEEPFRPFVSVDATDPNNPKAIVDAYTQATVDGKTADGRPVYGYDLRFTDNGLTKLKQQINVNLKNRPVDEMITAGLKAGIVDQFVVPDVLNILNTGKHHTTSPDRIAAATKLLQDLAHGKFYNQ